MSWATDTETSALPSVATRSQTETALAALRPWWSEQVARAGLGSEWSHLETALDAVPPSELPATNGAPELVDGYGLGLSYVESLDAQERSEHGRHYTPKSLASQLWRMARSALGFGVDARPLPGLVRDPACGAGALLVPVLREHLAATADADPTLVLAALPQLVEGIDTDPWAAYIASVVLAAELLPTLARVPSVRRRPLPALARVGDGLDPSLSPAAVWIMNPPYGRQRLSSEQRALFADSLYGHANLYALFLAAASKNVSSRGLVAALVPTSFTSGLYFHRLRDQVSARTPLRQLAFVQERTGVFGGVLQETCLAVFSTAKSRKATIQRISGGEVSSVAGVPSPRTSRPWLLPRESSDAALAAAASSMPLTLKDAGWHASTGPLVWNRRRAELHARNAAGRVFVLWAADMDGGLVHRDRSRDSLRFLDIRDEKDRLVNALTTPAVLVQRTTAPEQTRRLLVAELTQQKLDELGGAIVVENHVNVLRPSTAEPLLSRATLARVLDSPTFDRLMRCISGSVAVSSYELGSLPLPDASTLAEWDSLTGVALDAAIAKAYRLPEPS
ncbi:Eco57I restriction-modification methylase domain-containing protein [Clavibacter michiganensis]|uniref:Eco57I restriction-modification methylase domain-containing protein n=1 Tax=Clavibacter michiganensis TaxID=28447 RepID=UPI0026DA8C07|nr:Eco57I restriction-modification methylase domain-containing protein [Clavibacter michiganensis]MDO4039279.1 Eco57I restriction-modification methylase domain-containing protein [Clavibacter michiganensis]MDO4063916.1 Eco57I restriction-modification methylase domain-containing protein [Clavibacter michiganensis]MDO4110225.1 Eco57I restriction-modification methylase domain-containing protein [Clavibacter michiganensis]MDO4113403.1 Eco57I restriction-modification methylase domain-containing prot